MPDRSGELGRQVEVAATTYFTHTFDETMLLLLEARRYLARHGREDTADLAPAARLAFSVEALRLTTRLAHVMAWLMAQRAAHDGELRREAGNAGIWRLGGHEVCLGKAIADPAILPARLASLLQRSEGLYRRIARLDGMVAASAG